MSIGSTPNLCPCLGIDLDGLVVLDGDCLSVLHLELFLGGLGKSSRRPKTTCTSDRLVQRLLINSRLNHQPIQCTRRRTSTCRTTGKEIRSKMSCATLSPSFTALSIIPIVPD